MPPRRPHLRQTAYEFLRRVAPLAGARVVRDDYYSPVVDARAIPETAWERVAPMPGVELDLDRQLELIDRELTPFVHEFDSLANGEDQAARPFALENPMYGPMDSHILYAMVRHLRPARVLELGSGHSTVVIAQALDRNATDNDEHRATHTVVDPHPSSLAERAAATVRRESAATCPEELFSDLRARDLLFVDTSHVIRPAGEVVRVVLEILPALADGVVCHFHDVFRPFEYPRVLYEGFNVHWQEQYVVQALLSGNGGFEVLCANHALWRLRRERVLELFPSLRSEMEPSGFWIARHADAGAKLRGSCESGPDAG